ncbi:uncharacterized protein LOC6552411 isoform X2 [Drosophila erecta]|uniref:uncharacterized protein LOC6552411 isoform X2 n=1 Tax=Drosophila erecta TaxID=7220 RepID=UPI0007328B7B|nr:uncharacterized protein LOC6552411 isoform X2 [Drosophila erecta]EDV48767.2 uncharacterized protein Dere_GG16796 [Drosophila erecta]
MHRIPLHMVSEPCPEASEYITMSGVMCPRNLIECELFLKVLRKTTDAVFRDFSEVSQSCLDIAKKCMHIKCPSVLKMTFQSLTEIICRAPSDSPTCVDAILARSVLYMKSNQHATACNDLLYYESLDPALKTTEGTIVSQILHCVCLFMIREYQASKEKLSVVKELIEEVSLADKSEISRFLLLIDQYEDRINQARENVEFCKKVQNENLAPFKGFKLSRKIPFASQACDYSESIEISGGVFASCDIPKGEIVLVENPVHFQFSAPFLNCDLCGVHQEQLYTCDNCRFRTYCSKSCMESDAEVHQYECYGYKIGLIPMLEANMLFRLFCEAAEYILPALVDYALDGGVISDPHDAWTFILEHAQEEEKNYNLVGELLATPPNYTLLTREKYKEIVATAFRLSVFIYNDTYVADKYFYLLALVKTDIINVMAAILLRLGGHVLLNSHRDELYYTKPGNLDGMNEFNEEFDKCGNLPMPTDRISANVFSFYGVNAISDFVDCYNNVHDSLVEAEHEYPEKFSKDSPIFRFADRLHSICVQKYEIETIEDLVAAETLPRDQVDEVLQIFNTSKRCHLLRNIAKYFHQFVNQYFNKIENSVQLKSTLFVTLKTFRQNGVTKNVKAVSLPSGKVIGVTTKKIHKGEELVLCPDFSRHRDHNIVLDLARREDFNFTTNIVNENSNLDKRPSPEFVRHNKAFIVAINRTISAWKEDRLDLNLQLNLCILYGTYNSFLALHCEEKDETRFLGVLNFSMFLAMNGFLQHSSDNILHFIELTEMDDIYFKNIEIYRQTFCVIRCIMEQYIDIMVNCSEVGPEYPKMVLVSSSFILKRLQIHTEALIDNEEASSLYMEYCTYHHKWKTILNSFLMMPADLKNFLLKSKK